MSEYTTADVKLLYMISKLSEKPKMADLADAMNIKGPACGARYKTLMAKLAKEFDNGDVPAAAPAIPATPDATKKRGRKTAAESATKKAKTEEDGGAVAAEDGDEEAADDDA